VTIGERLRAGLAHPGVALLALIGLLLLLGPWLAPFGPRLPDWEQAATGPSLATGHWLGTDAIGRDILARVLAGGRVSLAVGVGAALTAVLLGGLLGAWAGFRGGLVDAGVSLVADVGTSLPFLLIVVLLLSVFEPSLMLLMLAIAGYAWIDVARIVRPEAARLAAMPFIEAARGVGLSNGRIYARHLLPNLQGPIALGLSQTVPAAILMESFLSFLGLSPLEGGASLGSLIADGVHELDSNPAALIAPALLLMAILYALQDLADGIAAREPPLP